MTVTRFQVHCRRLDKGVAVSPWSPLGKPHVLAIKADEYIAEQQELDARPPAGTYEYKVETVTREVAEHP